MSDVDRYITDETFAPLLQGIAGPLLRGLHEVLPGILARHRADVLREYGIRECLCPMPNPDCEHPSCPRDPEVQAIERRMADEAAVAE